MANEYMTKRSFADALKEIVKTKPLEKIFVKDITNYCGVSKNTFYYHFQDKYELLHRIFVQDVINMLNPPKEQAYPVSERSDRRI